MIKEKANDSIKKISGKTRLYASIKNKNDESFYEKYYCSFEILYDKYSPKIYGYLIKNTNSKQQADELLVNIFLTFWDNFETIDKDSDKQMMKIFLQICKPLYKLNNMVK